MYFAHRVLHKIIVHGMYNIVTHTVPMHMSKQFALHKMLSRWLEGDKIVRVLQGAVNLSQQAKHDACMHKQRGMLSR